MNSKDGKARRLLCGGRLRPRQARWVLELACAASFNGKSLATGKQARREAGTYRAEVHKLRDTALSDGSQQLTLGRGLTGLTGLVHLLLACQPVSRIVGKKTHLMIMPFWGLTSILVFSAFNSNILTLFTANLSQLF